MASDDPKQYTSHGDRGDVRSGPTPYGPHRDQKVDEAAGGADNSPLDTDAVPEQGEVAGEQDETPLRQPSSNPTNP